MGSENYGAENGEARMAGPETRKAKNGVGFLEREQPAPSPTARDLGECCKLPQWGPGRGPGRNAFSCILQGPADGFAGISKASKTSDKVSEYNVAVWQRASTLVCRIA